MFEAMQFAVGDGPVRVQRCEDLAAGADQITFAADIQIGVLLAGERGRWQVFGRRRTAHSDIGVGMVILSRQYLIGLMDFSGQVIGYVGIHDMFADQGPGQRQGIDVVDIQRPQRRVDLFLQVVMGDEMAITLGRDGETVRDTDPLLGQGAEHLAQRRVLAPDERNVIDGDLGKSADVAHSYLQFQIYDSVSTDIVPVSISGENL